MNSINNNRLNKINDKGKKGEIKINEIEKHGFKGSELKKDGLQSHEPEGETSDELVGSLRQLINITSHKKQRLQSILNMTKMQSQAIEQKDINLLTGCIQEKQRHIEAIDDLDGQFASIYDGDIKGMLVNKNPSSMTSVEQNLCTEFQNLISKAQGIVKDICELEKVNRLKAQGVMDGLKQKISHIQTGKKGYKAYNRTNTISDGIYIDQKN